MGPPAMPILATSPLVPKLAASLQHPMRIKIASARNKQDPVFCPTGALQVCLGSPFQESPQQSRLQPEVTGCHVLAMKITGRQMMHISHIITHGVCARSSEMMDVMLSRGHAPQQPANKPCSEESSPEQAELGADGPFHCSSAVMKSQHEDPCSSAIMSLELCSQERLECCASYHAASQSTGFHALQMHE